jgi:hypothetical protein
MEFLVGLTTHQIRKVSKLIPMHAHTDHLYLGVFHWFTMLGKLRSCHRRHYSNLINTPKAQSSRPTMLASILVTIGIQSKKANSEAIHSVSSLFELPCFN